MHYFLNGGLLSFDTGFGFWVFVTTIFFLIAMNKWLVPPIMSALKEREERIRDSMETAEKALAQAEEISKNNEKALKEAEVIAQKIRKEAIEDAEKLREERIEKATKDAEKLLENARLKIEQEKKSALKELRNQVAELAVQSASIIIKSELDKKKSQHLVDSFIKDLSKNN